MVVQYGSARRLAPGAIPNLALRVVEMRMVYWLLFPANDRIRGHNDAHQRKKPRSTTQSQLKNKSLNCSA
eukprot:568399-Rhodomonas_salina.1